MSKERSATFKHLVEGVARGNVEWQRGNVLHDHDVSVGECIEQIARRAWRLVGSNRERGQDEVGLAAAGERGHVVSQRAKRMDPFLGFDAHAVGAAQAKTHDGESSHRPGYAGEPLCGR